MEIIATAIPDVKIICPAIHRDARGYFFESFSERDFHEFVAPDVHFVQDNQSASAYGVVRGLHFQKPPYAQAKLVRCIEGEVLDVAVDIRQGSPTFGAHVAVRLSADNCRQLFIPRGFAHGFSVLSPTAVFQYKCDGYYAPQSEGGINPFSADLDIDWLIAQADAILSDKDKARPDFNHFTSPFV